MIPIPKSRIQENLYTNGTGIKDNITLRFKNSKSPYIGFYCIINLDKYYTGKTFDKDSKSLEKYNPLASSTSAILAAGSIPTIKSISDSGYIRSGNENAPAPPSVRYFYKDLGTSDIAIKEINQNAYNKLADQSSSNYQLTSYNTTTQTLEEVNKQMPGLAAFLGT